MEDEQLIHRMYEQADRPEGMGEILLEVGQLIGSKHGQTLLVGDAGILEQEHFGQDDEKRFEQYNDHWAANDPRFVAASASPNCLLSDWEDIDRAAFERSAIFNDFLVPGGGQFALFGLIQLGIIHGAPLMVGPAFLRSHAPFSAEERARLGRLLPHLTRAYRLRILSRALADVSGNLQHMLDAAQAPLLLLDREGRLLAHNALATRLLQPGGGLATQQGKLTAQHPEEAAALGELLVHVLHLADAGTVKTSAMGPPATLTVSRPGQLPLALVLVPLRPNTRLRDRGVLSARVVVFAHDPELRPRLRPSVLEQVHGLTPAESRLAAAIAEGQTLAQYAAARGISEHTVRTQIKRVFEKLGVDRQTELVRVVLADSIAHTLGM